MRIFIVTAILLMGSSVAHACGNPLLYAILFSRYPDAKVAYDAEIEGRKAGLLGERGFSGTSALQYHQWSLKNAAKTVAALNPTIVDGLERTQTITIVLADEVRAVRFSPESEAARMMPLRELDRETAIDAFTTTNTLRAIQAGEIDWHAAIENKLVVGDNVHRLLGVIGAG